MKIDDFKKILQITIDYNNKKNQDQLQHDFEQGKSVCKLDCSGMTDEMYEEIFLIAENFIEEQFKKNLTTAQQAAVIVKAPAYAFNTFVENVFKKAVIPACKIKFKDLDKLTKDK